MLRCDVFAGQRLPARISVLENSHPSIEPEGLQPRVTAGKLAFSRRARPRLQAAVESQGLPYNPKRLTVVVGRNELI